MNIVKYVDKRVKVQSVKELIESAGNRIFSVWFVKRSDGSKKKMSCRRKVRSPSYSKAPSGKISYKRKLQDKANNLITVFDCNCLKYNKQDKLNGRGSFKSIPLDGIVRLKINGEIYKII